jgi:hypothetical protein
MFTPQRVGVCTGGSGQVRRDMWACEQLIGDAELGRDVERLGIDEPRIMSQKVRHKSSAKALAGYRKRASMADLRSWLTEPERGVT